MTIKKGAPVQPLTPTVDPAVEAAMGDDPISKGMQKLQRARTMTPGKAKKAARDKARIKLTIDVPEWLSKRLEAIAGQERNRVPMNQLVAILIIAGLRAVVSGELDLKSRKIPSRTPAFDWFLQVDDEEDL